MEARSGVHPVMDCAGSEERLCPRDDALLLEVAADDCMGS